MDGVGDLPNEEGLTPLAKANTPNMDKLATLSDLAQTVPVIRGVTRAVDRDTLAYLVTIPSSTKLVAVY